MRLPLAPAGCCQRPHLSSLAPVGRRRILKGMNVCADGEKLFSPFLVCLQQLTLALTFSFSRTFSYCWIVP